MRRIYAVPILLLIAATAACRSPTRTYYEVAKQYVDVTNSLAEMRRAGTIDKRTGDKIDPLVKSGKTILNRWYEEIQRTPEGQKPDVGRAITDGIIDILADLSVWYARYTGGK